MPALRRLFAPGTAAAAAAAPGGSGGLLADIDELAVTLGHPSRHAGVVAVAVAAAAPAAGVDAEDLQARRWRTGSAKKRHGRRGPGPQVRRGLPAYANHPAGHDDDRVALRRRAWSPRNAGVGSRALPANNPRFTGARASR